MRLQVMDSVGTTVHGSPLIVAESPSTHASVSFGTKSPGAQRSVESQNATAGQLMPWWLLGEGATTCSERLSWVFAKNVIDPSSTMPRVPC